MLTIFRIADLLEAESEARQALDPDPFDDRPLGNMYLYLLIRCYS